MLQEPNIFHSAAVRRHRWHLLEDWGLCCLNSDYLHSHRFAEGVLWAEKDYNKGKHDEIDVPNLHVIKLMESFTSREFVRHQFAWRHHYWYLTNDGIVFLRDYLNLPSEVMPNTLKKSTRQAARPAGASAGGVPAGRGAPPASGDREAYREGPPKGSAPSSFSPSFGRGGG